MNNQIIFPAAYSGTKDFNQWRVNSANATGFGAAADDFAEIGIDLNEQLIRNKPATFFMRVNGDAMSGAGIGKGDVVIVDRSIEPRNGKVVIAVVDGEMLIRKLEINDGKKFLVSIGQNLSPLPLEREFLLWGVVTYVIHSV